MQKFSKEQINEIVKDINLFKDIIAYTWGDIFVQMEDHQVFPEKSVLIELEEASAFPFLFKNYHLEQHELVELRNKVRVFREIDSFKNSSLPNIEIDVPDNLEDGDETNSFSDIESLIKAYKEEIPIPYLDLHNLSLLEDLLSAGCSFDYNSSKHYNSFAYSNICWISKIIAKSSLTDIENISDNLCVALHDIVLSFSSENSCENTNYYQRFIELSDNVTLEDLKKSMEYSSLDSGFIVKAMKKIYALKKSNLISEGEDKNVLLDDSLNFLKKVINDETLSVIKEISKNDFIDLWDKDDFMNEKERFLKNAFYQDYIQNIDIFSEKMPKDYLSIFDENVALNFFKNRPAGFFDGESTNTVSLSKTSSLIVLRLLRLAINSQKNKEFNPSEFAFAVLSNVGGSDVLLMKEISETAVAVVKSFKDDNLIENISFIKLFENKNIKSLDYKDSVSEFLLKREISLPNAILMLATDVQWIDLNKFNAQLMKLHPNDINVLKELVEPLMSSVVIDCSGSVEATPFNMKRFLDKPNRLIGSDLFSAFLKSPIMFKELLSLDYKLNDIEKLLMLSENSDKQVSALLKDLLTNVFENKPELVPFQSDKKAVLDILRSDFRLNGFLENKYKHLSYKAFLNKIEMLDSAECELSRLISDKQAEGVPKYRIEAFPECKSLKKIITGLEKEINAQTQGNYLKNINHLIEDKVWERLSIPDFINKTIGDILLNSNEYTIDTFSSYVKKQDSLHFLSKECIGKIENGVQDIDMLKKVLILVDFSFSNNKENIDLSRIKLNEDSKKDFIYLLKDEFPHLLIIDTVFSLTKDLTAKSRCDFFELGLSSAKDSFISNVNSLSNKFAKNLENDDELIKEFRSRGLSPFQKLMVPLVFKQTKFKYHKDDFVELIKTVGCPFNLKELEKSMKVELNGHNTSLLFPEIFNHGYLKENINDYVRLANLSINFKEPLWDLSAIKANSDYINKEVQLKKIENLDNYLNVFRIALDSRLDEYELAKYCPIKDSNFNSFMASISRRKIDLKSMRVSNDNQECSSVDFQNLSKHIELLIRNALLGDTLSDENKNTLVNSAKAFNLSKNLLGSSSVYPLSGSVFMSNSVLDATEIYMKNNLVKSVFATFEESNVLDDGETNCFDFKI